MSPLLKVSLEIAVCFVFEQVGIFGDSKHFHFFTVEVSTIACTKRSLVVAVG
jgi:hypothetical protein